LTSIAKDLIKFMFIPVIDIHLFCKLFQFLWKYLL